MDIQTYSVLAGSTACNAKCPYCVSKMTPSAGMPARAVEPNWRNFEKATAFAKQSNVSTVLITGKGETTLFPEQITDYMKHLEPFKFPFIELQTNGIQLAKDDEKINKHLQDWYDLGMTTIALSIVHYESDKNKEIYSPRAKSYYRLENLVDKLHNIGFSVRLTAIMAKGYIEDMSGVDKLVDFAKKYKVEQLTVRPVEKPGESQDVEAEKWVAAHRPCKESIDSIKSHLDQHGHRLMELVHGAIVYDYKGQNVCLSNCLTINPKDDKIRQLIFFPDGHLRYDWQYEGAIIL